MNKWMIWGVYPYSWKHPYMIVGGRNSTPTQRLAPSSVFVGIPWGPTDLFKRFPNFWDWENTNHHRYKVFAIMKKQMLLVPLKDDDKPVYVKNDRTRNAQHFKIPPVAPLISMGGYTSHYC